MVCTRGPFHPVVGRGQHRYTQNLVKVVPSDKRDLDDNVK